MLHILSHHMGMLAGEIRTDLIKWIILNIKWIKQASAFLLDKKGINIMDYIHSMIRLDFVADQIALLVIACMYNIHIGVKNFGAPMPIKILKILKNLISFWPLWEA